jgi:hypothetical protein
MNGRYLRTAWVGRTSLFATTPRLMLRFHRGSISGQRKRAIHSRSFDTWREAVLCTKQLSTEYCNLPGKYAGKPKWPTLQELHTHLFGKGFDGAHDALADVQGYGSVLCRACEERRH